MDMKDVFKSLEARGVFIDPADERDPIDIGLELGMFTLKHLCIEDSGTFDRMDVLNEKINGFIVQTIGFGQAVFEVVPAEEISE